MSVPVDKLVTRSKGSGKPSNESKTISVRLHAAQAIDKLAVAAPLKHPNSATAPELFLGIDKTPRTSISCSANVDALPASVELYKVARNKRTLRMKPIPYSAPTERVKNDSAGHGKKKSLTSCFTCRQICCNTRTPFLICAQKQSIPVLENRALTRFRQGLRTPS